jgi:hypothetical protein
MTKEHEIILLASDKSFIHLSHNKLITSIEETGVSDLYKSIPQHLYVISNEFIKEKEYFFDKKDNCIYRSVDEQNANSINETRELYDIERYYKIIATTNDKISINLGKEKHVAPTNSNYDQIYTRLCPYPKPSQEFIEHFISQYNKGNVLSKVEVEYGYNEERIVNNKDIGDYSLVINSDNTINISIPSTKIYTSEEVKQIVHKYREEMGIFGNCNDKDCDIWLENNL